MSSYRPICDTWLLARPKVKYYGAFPSGFLERARALLGVSYSDPVLHVCGGSVRDYPFRGMGPNDRTLDLDPDLKPDFLFDARRLGTQSADIFPSFAIGPGPFEGGVEARDGTAYLCGGVFYPLWPAALVDRPYSHDDAKHYAPGEASLPEPADLLRRALSVVRPGGRVGFLDFIAPRPPKKGVRLVALVGVLVGYGNRVRVFSVYEKDGPGAAEERDRALAAVRGKKRVLADPPAGYPVITTTSCVGRCDSCYSTSLALDYERLCVNCATNEETAS